jgi:hypothetical protein
VLSILLLFERLVGFFSGHFHGDEVEIIIFFFLSTQTYKKNVIIEAQLDDAGVIRKERRSSSQPCNNRGSTSIA